MGELKSTLDLILEKYGGAKDTPSLTDAQKAEIAPWRTCGSAVSWVWRW